MKDRTVFISYAREDEELVLPTVHILRAAGATVFIDIEDIAYGEKWESTLLETLRNSERILVFWSNNASKSQWVRREYLSAISEGLRVVPVPLDNTPLSAELSAYQALATLVPLVYAAHKPRVMPLPQVPRSWFVSSCVALAIALSGLLLRLPSQIGAVNVASKPLESESEVLILIFAAMSIFTVIFLILLSSLIGNLTWNRALQNIYPSMPQGVMRRPQGVMPGLQRAIYELIFYT